MFIVNIFLNMLEGMSDDDETKPKRVKKTPKHESTVVLLDVGSNMTATVPGTDRCALDLAKEVLEWILTRKVCLLFEQLEVKPYTSRIREQRFVKFFCVLKFRHPKLEKIHKIHEHRGGYMTMRIRLGLD